MIGWLILVCFFLIVQVTLSSLGIQTQKLALLEAKKNAYEISLLRDKLHAVESRILRSFEELDENLVRDTKNVQHLQVAPPKAPRKMKTWTEFTKAVVEGNDANG